VPDYSPSCGDTSGQKKAPTKGGRSVVSKETG